MRVHLSVLGPARVSAGCRWAVKSRTRCCCLCCAALSRMLLDPCACVLGAAGLCKRVPSAARGCAGRCCVLLGCAGAYWALLGAARVTDVWCCAAVQQCTTQQHDTHICIAVLEAVMQQQPQHYTAAQQACRMHLCAHSSREAAATQRYIKPLSFCRTQPHATTSAKYIYLHPHTQRGMC